MDGSQSATRLLAVRAGGRRFGLPAESVREVSRIPRLTSVPHAPQSLLGVGNVRGEPLSIVSAARLLGEPDGRPRHVAIIDGAHRAALAIDQVEGLVEADEELEQPDFGALLAIEFPAQSRKAGRSRRSTVRTDVAETERLALLTFQIGEQIFALPVDQIEDVLRVPRDIARLPHADDATLGAIDYRGGVLPLFSLPALLALPAVHGKSARIVVVRIGPHRVGFVVDRMRALIRPAIDSIDPVPLSLRRADTEAVIHAIHRPGDGGRLVSILAADQLLREDMTARLMVGSEKRDETASVGQRVEMLSLLLIESAGHRLLFPLDVIREVARMPARLTSLPQVPPLVRGVAAFRGEALVLVDLAAHLGGGTGRDTKARVLIAEIARTTTGLLVDRVLGLVRVPRTAIEDAPPMGDARAEQFGQVVTLDGGETATLLLSPTALFSQVEADLIAGLANASAPAA